MVILWTSSMPLDMFKMYYNIIIQDNNQILIFCLVVSEGFQSSSSSSSMKNSLTAHKNCVTILTLKQSSSVSKTNQWVMHLRLQMISQPLLLLSDKGIFIRVMLTECQLLTMVCLSIVHNVQTFGCKFYWRNYWVWTHWISFGFSFFLFLDST